MRAPAAPPGHQGLGEKRGYGEQRQSIFLALLGLPRAAGLATAGQGTPRLGTLALGAQAGWCGNPSQTTGLPQGLPWSLKKGGHPSPSTGD